MPIPQWPDTHMPSRATRRRIRLRQDFENSMLASDLDEEDVSIRPARPPAPPPVAAAVPTGSQPRRDLLPATRTPPRAVVTPPNVGRPELWAEPEQDSPGVVARLFRMAAIGGAVMVCGLVLTKGLAEMVWEFVSR